MTYLIALNIKFRNSLWNSPRDHTLLKSPKMANLRCSLPTFLAWNAKELMKNYRSKYKENIKFPDVIRVMLIDWQTRLLRIESVARCPCSYNST